MWHALRAELAYFRPWLLGGLGLAAGISTVVTVVFSFVGEEGPPGFVAASIRAMYPMMAPLIVGFVIQSYRSQERRARLLLAGPLTPGELAGVAVLLPVVLLAIAVLAAGLVILGGALVTGELAAETLHIVGYVGGLNFMLLMMGLLGQEAMAARRQRRRRDSLAGWTVFATAALALTAVTLIASLRQGPWTWPSFHVANLVVAVVTMAASVVLYVRRTDFTR